MKLLAPCSIAFRSSSFSWNTHFSGASGNFGEAGFGDKKGFEGVVFLNGER